VQVIAPLRGLQAEAKWGDKAKGQDLSPGSAIPQVEPVYGFGLEVGKEETPFGSDKDWAMGLFCKGVDLPRSSRIQALKVGERWGLEEERTGEKGKEKHPNFIPVFLQEGGTTVSSRGE